MKCCCRTRNERYGNVLSPTANSCCPRGSEWVALDSRGHGTSTLYFQGKERDRSVYRGTPKTRATPRCKPGGQRHGRKTLDTRKSLSTRMANMSASPSSRTPHLGGDVDHVDAHCSIPQIVAAAPCRYSRARPRTRSGASVQPLRRAYVLVAAFFDGRQYVWNAHLVVLASGRVKRVRNATQGREVRLHTGMYVCAIPGRCADPPRWCAAGAFFCTSTANAKKKTSPEVNNENLRWAFVTRIARISLRPSLEPEPYHSLGLYPEHERRLICLPLPYGLERGAPHWHNLLGKNDSACLLWSFVFRR